MNVLGVEMARMKQMKEVGMALKSVRPPTELRVNLDKHPMPPSHLKLGAKMKMMVEGKVTSVHQDEYGKTCCVEISNMEHDNA